MTTYLRRKLLLVGLTAAALIPVTITCVPPADGIIIDPGYGYDGGYDVGYVGGYDDCYWGCGDAWGVDAYYYGP